MKTTLHPWSFSLSALLLCFVLVALAIFGGLLGVASGLQQTIIELTPANRKFAVISGLICGMVPAAIIRCFLRRRFRKPVAIFLLSACTALFASAGILYLVVAITSAA